MHIFITGGTGLVGSELVGALHSKGHRITVLTRDEEKARKKLGELVEFCPSLDSLDSLDDYQAVINLAGESIAGIWTKKKKAEMEKSRWVITQKLAELIKKSKTAPHTFISGSAIGYYGSQGDKILTENSKPEDEFTYRLCSRWEAFAKDAESPKTRVCMIRTGIVLSANGGMLPLMAKPFRMGLGSVMGTGQQFISWIHINDMVNAIIFLLENNQEKGPYNLTSPEPVTNRLFSKALAKALHRPCWFRIPAKVISTVMGESSALILGSQRAEPKRLLEAGFNFEYTEIRETMADIFGG